MRAPGSAAPGIQEQEGCCGLLFIAGLFLFNLRKCSNICEDSETDATHVAESCVLLPPRIGQGSVGVTLSTDGGIALSSMPA